MGAIFVVILTSESMGDLKKLKKSEPKVFSKATKLLEELEVHPTAGTGHPEQLKGFQNPTWSRRISHKHRLVYEVHQEQIKVLVISTYGHYADK